MKSTKWSTNLQPATWRAVSTGKILLQGEKIRKIQVVSAHGPQGEPASTPFGIRYVDRTQIT